MQDLIKLIMGKVIDELREKRDNAYILTGISVDVAQLIRYYLKGNKKE